MHRTSLISLVLLLALVPVGMIERTGASQSVQSQTYQALEEYVLRGELDEAIAQEIAKGKAVEALVVFEESDIQAEAKRLREVLAVAEDIPEIIEYKAALFRDKKLTVLSELLSSHYEIIEDYQHFAVTFVRFYRAGAILQLLQDPDVLYIRENRMMRLQLEESLPLIRAPEAHALGATGSGTSVAVLDTGVDYTKTEFGSCSSPGDDCKVIFAQDLGPDDGSLDDSGHGTNVAAIVLGVAPDTKIISLDVFQVTEEGHRASTNDILRAINFIIENKHRYNTVAINLSLGSGQFTSPCSSSVYRSCISNAKSAGIATIAASGNDGFTDALAQPACVPEAISVGAVYDSNFFSPLVCTLFSGGQCVDILPATDKVACWSNSASFLTLLAPGAAINAGGQTFCGTSQAAPHVAGAVAAIKSVNPSLTPDQIKTILTETGVPVCDERNNIVKPRLDLYSAVNAAPGCESISAAVRLANVDDSAVAFVNGAEVARASFMEDTGLVDISDLLQPGTNTVRFRLRNTSGGYAYGFRIRVNGRIIFNEKCGRAGVSGCNDNGQTTGVVYDKTVSIPLVTISSDSGAPGTVFTIWGKGFTPNSTLTSHLQRPDGSEFPLLTLATDQNGEYQHEINSTSFVFGKYQHWVEDDVTCMVSNRVDLNIGEGILNDNCVNATLISDIPFSIIQDTMQATVFSDDPVHSCTGQRDSNSVWYRFTAPMNGTATVNTFGSNYDTVLSAYIGSCGSLREIACHDDVVPGEERQSTIAFDISAGVTYFIEVATYEGQPSGTLIFNFDITEAHAAPIADSDFDNDDEGWVVVGDAQSGSGTPDYFPTGGNSGGFISATDDVKGDVWYWQAPPKFLGNISAAYLQALTFDLKQSSMDSQFDDDDVILVGGGITLVFDTPYNPGSDWTSYDILLHESAGWVNKASGLPPTRAEMLAVLSSLTYLRIRGEYRTGSDTGGLDNVILGGGCLVPNSSDNVAVVPGTADLWLAGQPDGTRLTDPAGLGTDVAPSNSPVSPILTFSPGTIMTFRVTGATNNDPWPPPPEATPDGGIFSRGGSNVVITGEGPAFGISNVIAPINSLVGVFLSSGMPDLTRTPEGLDFSSRESRNFSVLAPELQQVFFIGDGLTDGGVVQQFIVPPGATRLFLGSMDRIGTNFNNSGAFTVIAEIAGR